MTHQNPPLGGFPPPLSPGGGAYPPPQGGYGAPQGYPPPQGGYGAPQGYPPPQGGYGATPPSPVPQPQNVASNPASGKLFTWKSLLIAALLGLWIGSTLGVGITCNVMSDDETAGNPATTLYVMGGETELNALDLTANQEGLLSGEFATKLAKASGMKDLRIWTPDLIGKEGLQVLTLEILDGQLKLSWDQRSPTIENCPSKNKDKDFACLPEGLQVKMEKVDTYNGEAFKAKVTTDMLAYLFRKDEDGPAEAVPTAVPATTAETPKPASGKRRKPAPADPAPAPAEAEKPKPAKEPSAFDQLK